MNYANAELFLTRLLRPARFVIGLLIAASWMFAADAAAQPTLSINSPSVNEGDSGSTNMTFTVSLSAATTSVVTVDYEDAGTGTATSGTDYTALSSGTLTIAAGDTSGTITVSVTGDTTYESHETVVVTLSNPTNATLSTTASSGTGTIRDDERSMLSVNSPTVNEGDSGSTNMTFTVSLSEAVTQRVRVVFGITGGTATAGVDYTANLGSNNRIRLTFNAGQTSRTVTVAVQGDRTPEPDETVVVRLSGLSFGAGVDIGTGTGIGTIRNDDALSVSIDSPSVNEGDSGSTNMTFTVSLSATSTSQVTVDYEDAGTGTATSGTDYTALSSGTLTFAPGDASKTVTVAVQGDRAAEPDETVVVQLSGASSGVDIGTGTGTGTILDNDRGPPIVRIHSANVREGDSGSASLNFRVTLSAASRQIVTVDYEDTGTGTATSGTDYTALSSGTLTFSPGDVSQTITVLVQGDTEAERSETVVVTLSNPAYARLLSAPSLRTATGTIRDDDNFPVANAGPDQTVSEGDTVNLSGSGHDPDGDPVTFRWIQTGEPTVTLSGTTTATPSFTAPSGLTTDVTLLFSLLVRGGSEGTTDTMQVIVDAASLNWSANAGTDQTVNEGDEVSLSGSGPTNAGARPSYSWSHTGGGRSTVTLTGATTATPSFTAPDLTADDVLTFTLTMTVGNDSMTDTVNVTVRADNDDPTANAGTDQTVNDGDLVTLSGSGTDPEDEALSYSWSQTGGSPTVTLTGATTATPSFTAPNLTSDVTLTFTLTVTAGGASDTDTVNVTVRADNDDPTANAGTDQTVNDGDLVTLSGSGTDPEDEALSYSWSQTGGSPTVTLTGATTATPSFTAPNLTSDVTLTFTLTVTAGGASDTDTVNVTVRADNDDPTANAGTDQTVNDGDLVTLSGSGTDPEDEALSYSWSQTGGSPTVTLTGATTATPSFTAPNLTSDVTLTFTLTVTAGGASDTDTVNVTVRADNDDPTANAGTDQTVNDGDLVTLSGSGTDPEDEALSYSWSQTGGSPTVTLTGATTATPSFTAPNLTSDVTLTFTLTVTAGGASDTDTVNVTVLAERPADDTDLPPPVFLSANAGPDQTVDEGDAVRLDGSGSTAPPGLETSYSWSQTGGSPTVTLTGATTATASFTAPSDLAADVTLRFRLTVTAGGESDTDTVDVIVESYDAPTLSIDSPSVAEGDRGSTSLRFTASLSAASDRQVTVAYATADGTASAGSDYRATSGELRFAPGETELRVSVPVLGDLTPEADETFTLTLSNPVNAELARSRATGMIVNDDKTLASVADARGEEGDGGAAALDFRVALSVASALEVKVAYATADGTASAGSDYRATSGELRFAPGETELRVSVPVLGDLTPEADETFTLTLSNPVNAELARSRATGMIVNDDKTLASVADARGEEGDGGAAALDFRVALSVASALEVKVAYATADGTASAGSDYRATSGELRFAPGETELRVSVPVLGDLTPEADETFTLTLSNPVNAELARSRATGMIVNDDKTLASVADARGEEGDGGAAALDFRVALSVASALEVKVAYATADGTASAGSDYRATSGELRFAPGETELRVSVPVLGDLTPEADETFTLTLGSSVNAELGRAATGVIVDDDVARARTEALETSLAGFGRTLTWDAVNAISGRFKETSADSGSQLVLGGVRLLSGGEETLLPAGSRDGSMRLGASEASFQGHRGPAELDARGPWGGSQLSFGEFLQRSSFELAMAERDEGDDQGWNLSLWGRASGGRFSGQPLAGLSSNGDVLTGYLGLDAKFGERLLAGMALAHSDGEMGYGISEFAGDLDLSLTSVLPYMNFQLSEKLEMWSMVGIGWGEGSFRDAVGSGQTASQEARGKLDLNFSMAALGANRALATWGNLGLELKSDVFAMHMEGEPGGSEAQPEVEARSQGARLLLAGRSELMASEQGRLGVNLEFGGRWDGGDAQTGWGTEVGGGLDYRHGGLGLGVAVQGRYLLVHKAQSFEDKGVSLTLEFDPGVQGRGFSLALRPAWGTPSGGGAEALWSNEALPLVDSAADRGPSAASERLDLEWGYGIGLRGGAGLLKLQGALSHQGMGQRSYRFGSFLHMSERTRVSLELNRQERLGKPIHGLLINWERTW